MSAPLFTPGPWSAEDPMGSDQGDSLWIVESNKPTYEWRCLAMVCSDDLKEEDDLPKITAAERDANAHLIAAAPELYDGCNAMLGLVQLILGRDDLSAELREVLTTNHRIAEAESATAKARGDQ